jgi:nitroreductase
MDAIDLLLSRRSCPILAEPAPSGRELENICRAALHASDHALLRPWKFLVLEGESRQTLGDLFVESERAREGILSPDREERVRSAPLRAPMVIVAIADVRDHHKVPAIEQILSTGCAAQLMLVAAQAQGYGGIWRTGAAAYDPLVAAGLGLRESERIVAFLYVGTPTSNAARAEPEIRKHFFRWNGKEHTPLCWDSVDQNSKIEASKG